MIETGARPQSDRVSRLMKARRKTPGEQHRRPQRMLRCGTRRMAARIAVALLQLRLTDHYDRDDETTDAWRTNAAHDNARGVTRPRPAVERRCAGALRRVMLHLHTHVCAARVRCLPPFDPRGHLKITI
ncbi:hypothetical protein [Burkholderia latens]|uniref:Uncharacterized protein n=2 Tax=Burkholderia latens TaxID=488446 RepID=A0A6H9SSF3_9BURK|nr:hypothetical protein [Burkholderia latens]KAB0640276.1 hypothetical protein F7R21_17490 [Burkholderia latens]